MRAREDILTREERDVLILAAPHVSGHHINSTEIGKRLGVSTVRVKTLIYHACFKLKAHNRTEAIFLALIRREIRLDEVWSLDKLAELWISLYPDILKSIIHFVREELEYGHLPGEGQTNYPYSQKIREIRYHINEKGTICSHLGLLDPV